MLNVIFTFCWTEYGSYLKTGIRGLGARTDFANPALSDQLAFGVVVGNSGGDASTTRLGAL